MAIRNPWMRSLAITTAAFCILGLSELSALYHLGNDPGESKDLASEHPEIARELRILNQEWTREVGNR